MKSVPFILLFCAAAGIGISTFVEERPRHAFYPDLRLRHLVVQTVMDRRRGHFGRTFRTP